MVGRRDLLRAHVPRHGERAGGAGLRGVQVVDGRVARFSVVDDRLNAVQFADGRAIPRAAVFIRPPLRMFDPKLGRSRGCEIAHPDRKAVTGRPSGGFGCKVARDRIACARSFDSVLSTPSAVACAS